VEEDTFVGYEPGWIRWRQCSVIDDMRAFMAENLGDVPDSVPEQVDVVDGPGVKIVV